MKTKRVPKEHLEKLYLDEKKSIRKIAEELGVVKATVWRWLKRYEIPTRNQNEYKRTAEWRRNMSEAKRKQGQWSKEDNPNWKGGISRQKHGERAGGRVKSWRQRVKVRDDWVCQKCGIDGKEKCKHCGIKPRMHADHIKPWADYPELRFDLSNGRTLCEDCHIR